MKTNVHAEKVYEELSIDDVENVSGGVWPAAVGLAVVVMVVANHIQKKALESIE